MSDATASPAPFAAAAARVSRWLVLRAFLRHLAVLAIPLAVVGVAGVVAARVWFHASGRGLAFSLVLLWIAAAAVWAWLRRAPAFAGLAAWDRAAGEAETLASAWFFEQARDGSAGARLHLARAQERLNALWPRLREHLPMGHRAATWLAPVAVIALALSPWLIAPIAVEDRPLSAEAKTRAQQVGKALANQARELEPLKSLSAQEKKRVEELKEQLAKAGKQLEEKQTPRGLLEQLEQQARAAEKLADAVGGENLAGLSSAFLSELERNADTAELGNALRAEDLGRAAEEAKLLKARLGSRKPSLEEQKRIEEALKRALEKANSKDRNSAVGQSLAGAQQNLGQGNAGAAAEKFDELAQRMARAAQRQQAQARLRGLAQNFRGAGQQILGGQNLQRLAPAPAGTQPLPNLPMLGQGQLMPGQAAPGAGAPIAKLPLLVPGNRQGNGRQFPIPGLGNPNNNNQPPNALIPGGNGQNPTAAFPIPGAGMPGAGVGGGFPVPGAGVGGTQAGNGTAQLGGATTTPLAATQTGQVAPAPANNGPSEVRAVAGGPHKETAARSAQEIAVDFIKTEEAALAEEPLPASRRNQVLRYFTALRQQFEQQP